MNFSRSVKRLVIIIALSVVVILVSKSLLSKALKNLNIASQKKQQAQTSKLPATLPESAPALEVSSSPVASGSIETLVESSPVAAENAVIGR